MKKLVTLDCNYYCLIKDCLNMLEKNNIKKKDFLLLCNSILCLLSYENELPQDVKELEHKLHDVLASYGLYKNIR